MSALLQLLARLVTFGGGVIVGAILMLILIAFMLYVVALVATALEDDGAYEW